MACPCRREGSVCGGDEAGGEGNEAPRKLERKNAFAMALRRLSPPSRVWLALALLLATLVLPALCQFPGGGPKKKKAPANKGTH